MTGKIYMIKHYVDTDDFQRDIILTATGAFSTFERADRKAKSLFDELLEVERAKYPGVERHLIQNEGSYEITTLEGEKANIVFGWQVIELIIDK